MLTPNKLNREVNCQSGAKLSFVASYACFCSVAVYDYQFTNSEGCLFNKLVFFSW